MGCPVVFGCFAEADRCSEGGSARALWYGQTSWIAVRSDEYHGRWVQEVLKADYTEDIAYFERFNHRLRRYPVGKEAVLNPDYVFIIY